MSPRPFSFSGGPPQYTFVTEDGQAEARSHAMREHWKRRHQRNHQANIRHRNRSSRTLLPRSEVPSSQTNSLTSRTSSLSALKQYRDDSETEHQATLSGIPAQLLCGLSNALSSARPDPFQTCPIHLTTQHQKLLHHWIGTHAAMMFEDLEVTEFNPMRDVWFPLDLSNASSFNCIMAHSAAHLSHLYAGTPLCRGTGSLDALNYKLEAVRILRLWLGDPDKKLSEDAFSAVVRLLTFERYWGTVENWNIHRDGLQKMIDAKGGVESLHDNWRLELVIYLVSLMSQPSWLEPTNNLQQISCPPMSPILQQQNSHVDIHKVRCLWLISFIQDMRTFMGSFRTRKLPPFPFAQAAVGVLRQDFQHSLHTPSNESGVTPLERERLICLFSIGVLVQELISAFPEGDCTVPTLPTGLDALETLLAESHHIWGKSVHQLHSILYESPSSYFEEGPHRMDYTINLVQVLGTLSLEARQGVQRCLLKLLYQIGESKDSALMDDGWSPDSLLSSIHGH